MFDDSADLPAHAKLNLFLEIAGKRPDGYHDIESVFVEIDYADRLHAVARRGNALVLLCDDPELPLDSRNHALRAIELLWQRCGIANRGMTLRLRKAIPRGAGLGGGSSDAAAALRLANRLWDCGLDAGDLAALGGEIGSDVPFFLHGGTALVRGRGELVMPLPDFPETVEFGLALPPILSDTARAYGAVRVPAPDKRGSASTFVDAMRRGDARSMEENAFNRFEETVFRDIPALGALHRELRERLARPVRMSGSGSAFWFFAEAGWRDNRDLLQWAEDNGVRLHSARAVPAGRRGDG